ncbi:MAG: ATP-binding protein [Chlamydiae bacterium]|nr:ATP-binding protein [Chlamydiota bacterium]MBI3267127.1 ATP-binding protein [Chlamydiota bacterium]
MNVNRFALKELCLDLSRPEITFLVGARQVGKTYLMKEVEAFARSQGKKTVYFNLEIPSDLLKFAGSEEDIFKTLTTSAEVVFLDEFHYLKNASHFLKAVYDSHLGVKIFASGSSSLELHNHLLCLLAENQGSLVSVWNLASEVGLTAKTIEKYLMILEQTYVCYSCTSFSTNLGNELKKSRKYYFYDLGIRNVILKDFEYDIRQRRDKGALYESLVFLELLQKISPNTSLHFWRTKQKSEVDFVKVVNRKPIPIEVKSSLSGCAIPSGMNDFLNRYPHTKEGVVVNESYKGEVKHGSAVIRFIPWKEIGQGMG